MNWDTVKWDSMKNRYNFNGEPFYAVIATDGVWCDSSQSFETAMTLAAMDAGQMTFNTERLNEWLNNSGYSIVHSTLLENMVNAGVIK